MRTRRSPWLVAYVLLGSAVAIPAVILGGGEGIAVWVAAAVVLVSLPLWLAAPSYFLAIAGVAYAGNQGLMSGVELLHLGAISINGSKLFVLGVTTLLFVRLLMRFAVDRRVERPPISVLILGVLLADALVASAVSPGRVDAFLCAVRLGACLIVMIFTFYECRDPRSLEVLLLMTEIVSVVAAGSAVWGWLTGHAWHSRMAMGPLRALGSFGHPVSTAIVATVGLPSAVYRLEKAGRTMASRLWAQFVIGAMALGVIATFTRRAILVVFVFLILHLLSGQRRERSRKRELIVLFLLLGSLGLAGSLMLSETAVEERLRDLPLLGSVSADDASVGSGRGLIWKSLFRGFLDKSWAEWILGSGTDSARYAIERYAYWNVNSHNSFLEVLFDQGIIGLALYVWWIVALRGELRRVSRRGLGETSDLARVWMLYFTAYVLTVEQFGAAIYRVESRWHMLAVMGAVLGAARRVGSGTE